MREIQVLDKQTIDKIAAGEVVDRPASVIKELTENAIDANATAVTIEIKDGGTTFMRITDNGAGIPADQVSTAFLRHATSKIRKAEDLVQIASLGFRGEALSSIAAVAQVECITKTPEALTGRRYRIEGGIETENEEIGAPTGTTFIIRNLFFNTPARAKFLKSPVTEGNHVAAYVEELALSHPEISFKYIQNGQTRLYTSGNGNIREIVYQVYGRDITKELIPVEEETAMMKISGFIGKPNVARGNRNFENYFVNGRFVKSKVLSKAIEDAYHGFLMQHKYPFTLLYLEIDGEKVDVNVHPQKMEVRLTNQEELYHQLCLVIQNALMHRERIPEVPLGRETQRNVNHPEKLPVHRESHPEPFESRRRASEMLQAYQKQYGNNGGSPENHSRVSEDSTYVPAAKQTAGSAFGTTDRAVGSGTGESDLRNTVYDNSTTARNAAEDNSGITRNAAGDKPAITRDGSNGREALTGISERESETGTNDAEDSIDVPSTSSAKPRQLNLFQEDKVLSEQARQMFRIIGQIFETYWLIEYQDSLYIVDQHAAHEKVNYERMMKNYREKKVNAQMLYPSIVVNLSAKEAELVQKNEQAFADLGFEIEPFGGRSYKINAVPDNLYSVATDQMFIDILDQLEELGDISVAMIPERLASMSCKAAVKGNNRMSLPEANALIDELLTLENPYNCPHGRPTIISMSRYELDRKFKRIV